jgi:hypothetical protein
MNAVIKASIGRPRLPAALIFVILLLGCFGLLHKAQAVNPPPDGGYSGGNTAEGQSALLSLTTGTNNTAVGWFSLKSLTSGQYNTALGAAALFSADTTSLNTATGAAALFRNSSGNSNTADGALSLFSNTTGSHNTAVGEEALFDNTTGAFNTAMGLSALRHNMTGGTNTAVGVFALQVNAIGEGNTAVGANALSSNTTSDSNTAIGKDSLYLSNTIGGQTAVGYHALRNSNPSGQFCFGNTAVGFNALGDSTAGCGNTALGTAALGSNTTGSSNVAVGVIAGNNVTTASNVICIGAVGVNASNGCFIGNIWNQPGGSQAVYVNSDGKLGFQVSSRRFKDDIKPMEQTSEVIYGLKPVSFRYKPQLEPTRPVGFGLIAEDVEKINPDLVTRGGDGKVNSVRYDAVNAMLLNEFLKEHRKVEKLEAALEAVNAHLKLQDANIRKVRAESGSGGPALKTVANNP